MLGGEQHNLAGAVSSREEVVRWGYIHSVLVQKALCFEGLVAEVSMCAPTATGQQAWHMCCEDKYMAQGPGHV